MQLRRKQQTSSKRELEKALFEFKIGQDMTATWDCREVGQKDERNVIDST
jgi:hypothetical protein